MIEFSEANIKLWSRFSSRGVFGGVAAQELLETNEKVVFLPADVASSASLAKVQAKYPSRVINMGIAEQNMIGTAAGMAKEGFLPFVSSFAPFASLRCADQIRLCCSYMGWPLKIVPLASGLAMGINGATHFGFEDMAIMRALPNIAILSPADCAETIKAILACADYPGPVYVRLTGGNGNPPVYKEDFVFEIGKAIELLPNGDVAIIATGSMVHPSLEAAAILKEKGISCGVADMHTIRPLDTGAIDRACISRLVATVEEHSITGGLGSAVAEYLCEKDVKPPLLRIGLNSYPHADTYKNLLGQCGLTADAIAKKILDRIEKL